MFREDWFDLEMKAVFGVDVFASEFDKELGYQVYESQTFPLLLLRLENMNESVAEVICDFLDLDSFVLERSNTAQDKWYADLYTRFKADVLVPSSYLDQMYATAFVRHFYTAAEIAGFRKKWEKPESIGIVTSEA